MSTRLSSATLVLLAAAAAAAGAAGPPAAATSPATVPATVPATQPTRDVRTFLVTPAAEAGLTVRFDFPREEQYDGNGSGMFLQSLVTLPPDDYMDRMFDADNEASDAEFVRRVRVISPRDDSSVPPVLDAAIRYNTLSFDVPVRETGMATLLPYLNHARALANVVKYRARFATATGDFKRSVELIRALVLLAEDIDKADTPFLVNNLVGVGSGFVAVEEIHRLLERPQSPNMFWALRRLPVPFVDIRGAWHGEESPFELTYPILREARRGRELTAAEWKGVTDAARKFARETSDDTEKRPADNGNDLGEGRFTAERLAAARDDYARRYGHSAADVAALPPAHVVSAFYYHQYRDALDSVAKWATLPYPQALPVSASAGEKMKRLIEGESDNAFFFSGLTDFSRGLVMNAWLDRAIAATATVEAVRAYAATHGGRVPAALADLVNTPAPDNPATGRPFDYSTADNVSVISDPGEWLGRPLRYEVKFRR